RREIGELFGRERGSLPEAHGGAGGFGTFDGAGTGGTGGELAAGFGVAVGEFFPESGAVFRERAFGIVVAEGRNAAGGVGDFRPEFIDRIRIAKRSRRRADAEAGSSGVAEIAGERE